MSPVSTGYLRDLRMLWLARRVLSGWRLRECIRVGEEMFWEHLIKISSAKKCHFDINQIVFVTNLAWDAVCSFVNGNTKDQSCRFWQQVKCSCGKVGAVIWPNRHETTGTSGQAIWLVSLECAQISTKALIAIIKYDSAVSMATAAL